MVDINLVSTHSPEVATVYGIASFFFSKSTCTSFLVLEMPLSTHQFGTIKRGCVLLAEGSVTSSLMTERAPDCRRAPRTCFYCAFSLYVSTKNVVCLLFFSPETIDLIICSILQHLTTEIRKIKSVPHAETGTCNFHLRFLKARENKWLITPARLQFSPFRRSLRTQMNAFPTWHYWNKKPRQTRQNPSRALTKRPIRRRERLVPKQNLGSDFNGQTILTSYW